MRITVEFELSDEQLDILVDVNNGITDDYDSWVGNANQLARAGLLSISNGVCRYALTGSGLTVLSHACAEQVMN